MQFLRNLRNGTVDKEDIKMLRSLVIRGRSANSIDFNSEPWSTACLVTPRHAVRTQWNDEALKKMCEKTGKSMYICTAEDTMNGRPLTMNEKCILEKTSW